MPALLLSQSAWAQAATEPAKGSLRVRVLTIAGQPVENASVYWYRARQPMGGRAIYKFTDAGGWVSIDPLEEGNYWVAAFKTEDGYPNPLYVFNAVGQSSREVQIRAGQLTTTTLRLGPKGAWLEVQAVDAETGVALAGAQLRLERAGVPNSTFFFSGQNLATLVPSQTPITLAVVCEGYRRWEYVDPVDHDNIFVLEPGSRTTVRARLMR